MLRWLGIAGILLPLSAQAGETVLSDEDFVDNSREWFLGNENPSCIFELRDGRYRLESRYEGEGACWSTKPLNLDESHDYAIEMTVWRAGGTDENRGFGLLFGSKVDISSFYNFIIAATNYARSAAVDGGHDLPAVFDWTPVTVVPGWNTLRVEKRGANFIYLVNGKELTRVPSRPLYDKRFGVIVYARQNIMVDRLRTIDLTPEPPPPLVQAPPPPPPPPPPPVVVVEEKPPPPPPPPRIVLAVLDIVDASGKTDKKTLDQLTELLAVFLAQKGTYGVVPREQVRDRLREQKVASYKECYESSCQIELGKAVAAEAVITSKLLKVGSECTLTATLFDLKKETTIKAANADGLCTPKALKASVRAVADQL